jgi:hypothetical protein
MVADNSTWEAEGGGLRVQGQSGLHVETLSQKTNHPSKPQQT